MTINIFIPDWIKHCSKGYLCGKFYQDTNLGKYGIEISTIIIDWEFEESESENSIGVVNPGNNFDSTLKERTEILWIVLQTIPDFLLTGIWINCESVVNKDINIIFYSPYDISHSALFNNQNENINSQFSVGFFVQRMIEKAEKKQDNPKYDSFFIISEIINVYLFLSSCIKDMYLWFNKLLMKKFGVKSSFFQQTVLRCIQINTLFRVSNRRQNLLALRICGIIFLDVLIGILFLYIFHTDGLANELHSEFQVATKILASIVQTLLDWLRGAPAGLKLNQPLAEALSNFFSYHVYLWTIYIDVASPVLLILAHLFVYVGIFGLSFQVALMRDFLNLSVLHIHCFYIYAARLHMVQVSLFGSQWRGFRGWKYNPLKQRVDVRAEVKSRPIIKILSAVGFTFVVFLLPTTTVFYAVFVMLRLFLLTLQGMASLLLWAINSNPISIICLHFINSSRVKGELHFEPELYLLDHGSLVNPLILKLSIQSSPLGKVIAASRSDEVFLSMPALNLAHIFRSLIYARELL